jgi:HupE / UreJ protein
MQDLQRARRVPGPLLLITLAWLVLSTAVVRAHDPGLSSLDVNVSSGTVSASLSIAASDVALIAPTGDARPVLRQLARDAVRLAINDELAPWAIHSVAIEDGAARVQMSFALTRWRDRAARLSITTDVPKRIAQGHRELVVVKVDDRVVAETLLDRDADPIMIELDAVSPSLASTAGRFLELGFRHILGGYDHLVFLAGLLLAAQGVRQLVVALTAFTFAHSVSLGLVVIGGFHASTSIVEPLIAASIAWVGIENLIGRQHGARWFVIFGFGLVHGFGFAGALVELGFGSSAAEMALALISFNLGVESGQLAVAAAMLPIVWTIRSQPVCQARLVPLCSMMIVMAGGYWLFERLS